MGLRSGAAFIAAIVVTPAFAGAVLPFGGAYGNDAGCAFYIYGAPPAGDYFLLTPDTFASPHLSCDFASLVTVANGRSKVDAVCSPGGRTSIDIVDKGEEGLAIEAHGMLLGPHPVCPTIPADPRGTVHS